MKFKVIDRRGLGRNSHMRPSLTRTVVVTVDAQDAHLLRNRYYQVLTSGGNNGHAYIMRYDGGVQRMLSHDILDVPSGWRVEYVDGDPLNCVRGNLRLRAYG